MHYILIGLLVLYAIGVIANEGDVLEIYRKIMGFLFLLIVGFFTFMYLSY